MVATLDRPTDTHRPTHLTPRDSAVLARLHDGRGGALQAEQVLGIVRRAADDGVFPAPKHPDIIDAPQADHAADAPDDTDAGPTLTLCGATHRGPLGRTTTARVFERYLDRLDGRLAELNDAIDRADLASIDDLLHDVARSSRQHGCRSVCHAAEDALGRVHQDRNDEPAIETLRRVIAELNELADEVATTTRKWTESAGPPPRA